MEKECKHCKQTFTVQRIDSVYCSRSCRQMAYIARKTTQLKTVTLNNTIQESGQIIEVENVDSTDIFSNSFLDDLSKMNEISSK